MQGPSKDLHDLEQFEHGDHSLVSFRHLSAHSRDSRNALHYAGQGERRAPRFFWSYCTECSSLCGARGTSGAPLLLVLLYRFGKTENNHQISGICAETDRPAGLCSRSDGISEIGLNSTILPNLLQNHTERKNMSVFRGKKFQIVPKPSVFFVLDSRVIGD